MAAQGNGSLGKLASCTEILELRKGLSQFPDCAEYATKLGEARKLAGHLVEKANAGLLRLASEATTPHQIEEGVTQLTLAGYAQERGVEQGFAAAAQRAEVLTADAVAALTTLAATTRAPSRATVQGMSEMLGRYGCVSI